MPGARAIASSSNTWRAAESVSTAAAAMRSGVSPSGGRPLIACGFGTVYEALLRIGVSGRDRLLVAGLGPVGLAVAMLGGALGATEVIGAEISPKRLESARDSGLFTHLVTSDDTAAERILRLTGERGAEASVDCSGSPAGRLLALAATRRWGRCAFVGEGGEVSFDVSKALIHKQLTLAGSWVTSLHHMRQLTELLARRGLHPEMTVTHRLPLDRAADAYACATRASPARSAWCGSRRACDLRAPGFASDTPEPDVGDYPADVSPLRIRRVLHRHRRRAAVIPVVLLMAALVAAHHSGMDGMGGMGVNTHTAVEMCLGLLALGAVVALNVVGGHVRLRRWSSPRLRALPMTVLAASQVLPQARAGPRILCVLRR